MEFGLVVIRRWPAGGGDSFDMERVPGSTTSAVDIDPVAEYKLMYQKVYQQISSHCSTVKHAP